MPRSLPQALPSVHARLLFKLSSLEQLSYDGSRGKVRQVRWYISILGALIVFQSAPAIEYRRLAENPCVRWLRAWVPSTDEFRFRKTKITAHSVLKAGMRPSLAFEWTGFKQRTTERTAAINVVKWLAEHRAESKYVYSDFATYLLKRLRERLEKIDPWFYRPTYYMTLDGPTVLASIELIPYPDFYDNPTTFLLVTQPSDIPTIMEDFDKRLLKARQLMLAKAPRKEALTEFATAVYAYYQAGKYTDGHFLGQAAFEGFYSAIFGGEIKEWPSERYILEGLTLSQRRFVQELVSVLE